MALDPILILGDVHRPYHDKKAWALVLKVGRWLRPKHLWLLGDFCDFYAVSAHSKDPRRKRNLEDELVDVHAGLDALDALGATHKIYLAGNHEDRLRRYLQDKAPELFGVVEIPQLLGLPKRHWTYVPYKDYHKVGKVHLAHDVGQAGRYATYKALDAFQHTILTGHSHRLSYLVEGNCVGEHKLSASFGWLGDVGKVDYMHKAGVLKNWALGFGVGWLDTVTGYAYLTPVPIVKYTCCVNGKLFG